MVEAGGVGARVARHATLSLLGFLVPLAIAVVAIPIAAHALGPARFGLLGLAWAVTEYLGFLDLGLGRSTVRFVADARVRAPGDLRQIVSVSVFTQFAAGLLAGTIVWLAAGALAFGAFSIPGELRVEAAGMFRMVAFNVVAVMVMGALRGVLEGAQRFDLATALKIPGAAAAVVVAAAGAVLGADLPTIVAAIFAVRMLVVAALFAVIPAALKPFRWEMPVEWRRLRSLLSYSGWVAVSGAASPVLVSADRFLLGAITGVAAVGFYTAPYEAITRLLLVPASMVIALFPTLTTAESAGARDSATALMESAARQLLIVMLPPILLVLVLAPELLTAWVGPVFSAQGATALRILAAGVLINSVGHLPYIFLYSAGRPDLPARLHLVELLIHIPLTLLLVRSWGITGAATAWTVRVTLDTLGLLFFSARLGVNPFRQSHAGAWIQLSVAGAGVVALASLARALSDALLPLALTAVAAVVAFGAYAWTRVLSDVERNAWTRLLAPLRRG